MEYLYIFLFFLAFAMVGLMIGLTLEEAFADYFDAVNIRYNDNPVTCIFEPKYDEEYFNSNQIPAVFTGVKEWENILTKATGGDWYIPIYVYKWEEHIDKEVHDYLDCDIFITFEEHNDGKIVNNSALGFNYYNHSWSKHKYSHIVVFSNTIDKESFNIDLGVIEDGDVVEITLKSVRVPDSDIHHIVKHEYGHAVGLLHHWNDDRSNDPRSVMHPTFTPFEDYYMEIQPRDVYGVVQLYGEDGWGTPNPAFVGKKIESLEWFIPKIDVLDVRVLLQ